MTQGRRKQDTAKESGGAGTIFGRKLKEERLRKGLSQEDLARLLECARTSISMIEHGHMAAFDDEVYYKRLAGVFGGTPQSLTWEQWKALADQSRRSFHLTITNDDQRATGDVLARYWDRLPKAALRVIRQTVMHSMGDEGKGSGGKSGGDGSSSN